MRLCVVKIYFFININDTNHLGEKMRTTPEKRKKTLSKYNNKPERKEALKQYYQKNKEKAENRMLYKNYGITLEEYDIMLKEQNGNCYICEKSHKLFTKRLAVDHCHNTGKVRKLLCIGCNTSLGLLKEDVDRVKKLIKYIEENYADSTYK